MKPIERFFHELDEIWPLSGDKVQLPIIGSAALLLQTDYERGTRDCDILEINPRDKNIEFELLG